MILLGGVLTTSVHENTNIVQNGTLTTQMLSVLSTRTVQT